MSKMHETKISLSDKIREEMITILNMSLASTADLYAQLKQAHWNIRGPEFIGLHKLLDELAEGMEDQIDIIAERVTALGGTALGTTQSIYKNTQLRVYPTDIFSMKDHVEHLTHNIAILGEISRKNIEQAEKHKDMVTSDVCIDLARILDKFLWLLEAHVQK